MKKNKQITVFSLNIIKANNDLQLVRSLQFLPWKIFTAESADEFFTRHITKLTKSIESGTLTSAQLGQAEALRSDYRNELQKYIPGK